MRSCRQSRLLGSTISPVCAVDLSIPGEIRREVLMPANRYDFWTHGVTTIIERSDLTDEVERSHNHGMHVRQRVGENWFGIPITRPVTIAGEYAVLDSVRMRYALKCAHVLGVEFRRGRSLIEAHTLEVLAPAHPVGPRPLGLRGFNKVVFCRDKRAYRHASILLWVHVQFEEPVGDIWFGDTGAHYFVQHVSEWPLATDSFDGEDEEMQLDSVDAWVL